MHTLNFLGLKVSLLKIKDLRRKSDRLLGEKDQVFEQSEKAYEEGDPFCLIST